jgi:hypothetical protein
VRFARLVVPLGCLLNNNSAVRNRQSPYLPQRRPSLQALVQPVVPSSNNIIHLRPSAPSAATKTLATLAASAVHFFCAFSCLFTAIPRPLRRNLLAVSRPEPHCLNCANRRGPIARPRGKSSRADRSGHGETASRREPQCLGPDRSGHGENLRPKKVVEFGHQAGYCTDG